MNKNFLPCMTIAMVTKNIAILQLQLMKKYKFVDSFYFAFCSDELPLKILEQRLQVVSDIKCCNYQIFNFVVNGFKVKN